MELKVLYIHHCGTQGGSSRSLREMIQAFPEASIKPHIISPKGFATDYFASANIPTIRTLGVSQFDMSQLGYYRKLRWLILLRELFYIPFTIIAIIKAKYIWKNIDLAHINDIQSVIPSYVANYIFKVPIVHHVRCPIMTRKGRRYSFLKRFLQKKARRIIAIDETVKRSLHEELDITVVHNGLILPSSEVKAGGTDEKRSEIYKGDRLTIGMVSNLLVFKGVLDFVEAARRCLENKMDIDFVIIGGRNEKKGRNIIDLILKNLGFKHFVDEEVYNLIDKYHLSDNFKIEGFVQNLAEAYAKIDVLCFPSHIDAVGRPVFEAGFFKVPSIVTINHPYDDAIIHKKTGICIKQKTPDELVDAINHFYQTPSEIKRMGGNAYNLANKNYDIYKNAIEVLNIYYNITKN